MYISEKMLPVIIELYDIIKPNEEKDQVFKFIHTVCYEASNGSHIVDVLSRSFKLSEYKIEKVKTVIGINPKNSYN
jgi:hypothetical protein